MLGYTAAELIGRATPEIFYKPEEVAARAARLSIELGRPVAPGMEALSIMARLGQLDERECTYHRRDGSGVRVQLSVSAMRDDAGAITGFVAIGHDISERDALVREHAQLAAILDTTRDFVSISDGQQHAWFINREGLRMTGLARTAPQEMYDMTLVHPPWAMELIRREALPAAKEKGSWMGETALLDANGREIPVSQLLMAHRDSHGELEFISTVARDISDLKRAEAERERARREAERANAAKSQFLSRMSHELRTPMNAILGFAQLLDMEIEEPKQRRMLGRILRGGGHLLALLDELLDVSRIETGRLCISIEPVDVSEAVTEAVVLIESAAGAGKVTIHATSARRQTRVFADRQRLRQVLLNLLSNAVKYNEPGGRVFVSQEPAGDFVRINVRDTGAGIPEEKLGLLFRYFERLGAEQTAVEGTGIGLALSKRLIEAMAGRIGVSSEPGRGSNFWIELPLVNTGPDEPMLDPRIAIVTAPVQ
jgi:PAS domain S-box-containing protein